MERIKMPRQNRAAQFAPFDALKGLQDSLSEKEYENEKTLKKDLTEEEIQNLEKTFLRIKNNDTIEVTFYDEEDGHYKSICGNVKVFKELKKMKIYVGIKNFLAINFNDIFRLKIINKNLPD